MKGLRPVNWSLLCCYKFLLTIGTNSVIIAYAIYGRAETLAVLGFVLSLDQTLEIERTRIGVETLDSRSFFIIVDQLKERHTLPRRLFSVFPDGHPPF